MTAGDYREQDLLLQLKDGLPDSFDVFHGLGWSAMHDQQQQFGELDLTVVSPDGQVLILEVKAGDVQTQLSFGVFSDKKLIHPECKCPNGTAGTLPKGS